MDKREKINASLKDAMREKDQARLSTLRLINAAIKDRDIALRGEGRTGGAGDDEVLEILAKMVKQRHESARSYEEGGRLDLAERERSEILIVEEFMPRKLSQDEVDEAIREAISNTGAASIRDMGKVMGALKERYAGRMDFGAVGPAVKNQLAS